MTEIREAEIKLIPSKCLLGLQREMSYLDNQTASLWQSFMKRRNEIEKRSNSDLISLQIYPPDFFQHFNPAKRFVKWACVEVESAENCPEGMQLFELPAGLYAVFPYKGSVAGAAAFFSKIFQDYLPASDFVVDHRPHFEVLGAHYKPGSEDSEEEVWIPIKLKTNDHH